jgi:hypothetical protein
MIAKFSEHEPDGGEAEEGEGFDVEVFPVFRQSAASVEPCQGALDNPSFGKNDKPFGLIRTFDDFGFDFFSDHSQPFMENGSLIRRVGEEFSEERKFIQQGRQQHEAAIPVLHPGGMNDGQQ